MVGRSVLPDSVQSSGIPSAGVPLPLSEQRVVLRGVSWSSYEQVSAALGDCSGVRLSYYRGLLEIMAPLESHEGPSSRLGQFVNVVTEESDRPLKSLQSTRLRRVDLEVGAEPDQCYYIANEPLVRGKLVDLAIDPPPDLVVEVDISHTDLDKPGLYAAMGVPEFWRYDGEVLRMYGLEGGRYVEREVSLSFPLVPKSLLYAFFQDCLTIGETGAKRLLRERLRA